MRWPRRWKRAGEEVALFAMFDAPLPSIFEGVNVDDDARFLCELVSFASRFSGTDIQIDHEELTKLAPEEQFQFALAEARKTGIVPAETPEAYIRRLVRAGEANVRVLQGYEPSPLTTPIRLFVPTSKTALEGLAGIAPVTDEDRGWSSRDGQVVELHEVPGDHFTMMLGEGAVVIAQHLNKLLAAGAERGSRAAICRPADRRRLSLRLRERDDHSRQMARDRTCHDEAQHAKYDQCGDEQTKCKIRSAAKEQHEYRRDQGNREGEPLDQIQMQLDGQQAPRVLRQ